jgi:hypothetical protein
VTLPYMHKPSVRRLRLASPVAGARQPVTPRGPRAAQVGSFAHTEFNQAEFRNLTLIVDRIARGRDLFGRGGAEDCLSYDAERYGLPEGAAELAARLARLQRGRPRGRGSGRLLKP